MTTPPGDDADLRALLHDAVSDVEPHGTLDQVHSRSREAARGTRRWFLPTVAAAAATVAVIGGVVLLTSGEPREGGAPAAQRPADSEPGDAPAASSPGSSPDSAGSSPSPSQGGGETEVTTAVPAYFVGDTAQGPRLFREFQRQQICAGSACKAEAAVRTAVAGRPADPDYRVGWPSGTSVTDVTWDGDLLTVDLSGNGLRARPAGMAPEAAELAVQQVIYSAQAGLGEGRPAVRLRLDGQSTDEVLGVPTSEPLTAASADSVLAAVWVTSPAEGATVPARFEVTGQAATFEANVVWELEQGGTVVRRGFTTARECCTLSPYSFTVRAPAGEYTLVVHDTDESGGEGVGETRDTKRITVR